MGTLVVVGREYIFSRFCAIPLLPLYVGQQLLGNLGALSFEEEILLLTADLSLYSVREC